MTKQATVVFSTLSSDFSNTLRLHGSIRPKTPSNTLTCQFEMIYDKEIWGFYNLLTTRVSRLNHPRNAMLTECDILH